MELMRPASDAGEYALTGVSNEIIRVKRAGLMSDEEWMKHQEFVSEINIQMETNWEPLLLDI